MGVRAAPGLAEAQQLDRESEGDVGGRQRIPVASPHKAFVRVLVRRVLISLQLEEDVRVDRQRDAGVVPRDGEEARLVELARLLRRDAPAIAAPVGPELELLGLGIESDEAGLALGG